MAERAGIVVVGASLAGLRAIEALRGLGFEGRISCIGDEPHRPYDRPPLSKDLLAGKRDPAAIVLRATPEVDELDVTWQLGRRALALDVAERHVVLDDGERLAFDGLVIATGARARRLRGEPALAGVHRLRTLDDAIALRDALVARPRVVVVGAGFIGAEVAATCRGLGLDVTLIEPLAAPLLRGAGERIGTLVGERHRDHGVDLRCGVGVEAIEGAGRVEAVRLTDGARVAADLVVVGVGASPITDWLEGSGLALDDGVVCDARCLAAPGIVAAGDVARWQSAFHGGLARVEHWTNAVEQGAHAAATLLDPEGATPYAHVPWVWTDQYELRLQMAGLAPAPGDAMHVVQGTIEQGRFVALVGRAGRLAGAIGLGRARHVNVWRQRMAEGISLERALREAAAS